MTSIDAADGVRSGRILFWALDALARREPQWRLADGALDTLAALSAAGWTHVAVIEGAGGDQLERLGLSAHIERVFDGALARAIEAARPFDEAFVIGSSVARHIMPAREASVASILVGDASPFAQFCVETLPEIPDAFTSWNTMRRAFLF